MPENKPKSFKRRSKQRDIRLVKRSSARRAIGDLSKGCEIYILTYGQFSLIDVLAVLLEQTGAADVAMATWTAADADLQRASVLVERLDILRMRILVDRSFVTRQPEYCATMRELFGDDCIRTCRLHAKFLTIQNETWNLAVRTSMNLNENPRLENLEISDDLALCRFLNDCVDTIYNRQKPSTFDGEMPSLGGKRRVLKTGKIRMGVAKIGV